MTGNQAGIKCVSPEFTPARKLAVIAWMMLKNNEPYRYALPKTTEAKLSRLRVKATGQRRVGGPSKGTKATAKLPGGSRTIKPLAEVCRVEGVPEPQPLSPGEQRTLRETLSENFFATIAKAQVVPRRSAARRGTADQALETKDGGGATDAGRTDSSSLLRGNGHGRD